MDFPNIYKQQEVEVNNVQNSKLQGIEYDKVKTDMVCIYLVTWMSRFDMNSVYN